MVTQRIVINNNHLMNSANKHRLRVFLVFLSLVWQCFSTTVFEKEIARKALFPRVFLFLSLMGYVVIAESLEERFCDLTQNSCVNCQNKSFATDAQTDKKI